MLCCWWHDTATGNHHQGTIRLNAHLVACLFTVLAFVAMLDVLGVPNVVVFFVLDVLVCLLSIRLLVQVACTRCSAVLFRQMLSRQSMTNGQRLAPSELGGSGWDC